MGLTLRLHSLVNSSHGVVSYVFIRVLDPVFPEESGCSLDVLRNPNWAYWSRERMRIFYRQSSWLHKLSLCRRCLSHLVRGRKYLAGMVLLILVQAVQTTFFGDYRMEVNLKVWLVRFKSLTLSIRKAWRLRFFLSHFKATTSRRWVLPLVLLLCHVCLENFLGIVRNHSNVVHDLWGAYESEILAMYIWRVARTMKWKKVA